MKDLRIDVAMRKALAFLIMGLSFIYCSKAEKIPEPISFYTNLEAAREAALAKNQPLVIEFYKPLCRFSQMMDDSTFSNKTVMAMAESMVFAKIDASRDTLSAARNRITFFPTIVVAKPDGNEIDRLVGYYPPADFFNEVQLYLQNNETLNDYLVRLEDEPDRLEYLLAIGDKYKYHSDWNQALEYYQHILNAAEDSSQYEFEMAKFGIADVYCESEQYRVAAEAYQEFLDLFPDSEKAEDAARKLPYCLIQLNDLQRAKELFEGYLNDYPNGIYRFWVEEKLDDLNEVLEAGTEIVR